MVPPVQRLSLVTVLPALKIKRVSPLSIMGYLPLLDLFPNITSRYILECTNMQT